MDISRELFTTSLGDVIDRSRDSLTEANTEYQEAEHDFLASEEVYTNLDLPHEAQEAVDDMIMKKDALDSINADLSYIAGALDAVKLLKLLGVIDERPADPKIPNL